jgi:hypothetical protein
MTDKPEASGPPSKDLPHWAKYLLSGLGGAILTAGGGWWVSYSDFRKERAEANSTSTEQTIEASEKLRPIIDRYTKIALGKAEPSSKDNDLLRSALRDALEKAEDTRNRWGGLDRPFQAYSEALVKKILFRNFVNKISF